MEDSSDYLGGNLHVDPGVRGLESEGRGHKGLDVPQGRVRILAIQADDLGPLGTRGALRVAGLEDHHFNDEKGSSGLPPVFLDGGYLEDIVPRSGTGKPSSTNLGLLDSCVPTHVF